MNNTMHEKGEFTTVYTTDKPSADRAVGLRRYWSILVKLFFSALVLGICLALVYEMIAEKQNYDTLLEKYNELLREKNGVSAMPAATLRRRADENFSFAYTTTTKTEHGIVTVTDKVFASPTTTAPALSTGPANATSSLAAGGNGTLSVCHHGFSPVTVTVTVTEPHSTSTHSSRITTTTVIVTATPSSGTGTAAPSAEMTSATDAVFTTTNASGYGPYLNTSSPTPSGTGHSGSMFTTASFTLIFPTSSADAVMGATSSSDKQATTHTTSTGENGPTEGPVTGAGRRMAGHDSLVVLVVALVAAMALM